MNPPEKFLIAMILIGYAAVEIMLVQHGGTVVEMVAALLVAAVLVLYVYLTSRRAAHAAAAGQGGSACSSCSSSSCGSCASAPRPPTDR